MYGPRTPQRGSDGPLALRRGWVREITSMKKLLLSFLMVFLALPALADQVTLTASKLTDGTWKPSDDFSFTFQKNDGGTNPT